MEIETHVKEYKKIIRKYNLDSPDKASEIADFLTKQHGKKLSSSEFASLFSMEEKDATIFLSFIEKGLQFKKKHIDKED